MRAVWLACATGLGVAVSSCVEPFGGSKVEILLHSGVQVPGDDPLSTGRPPSDTHYELYVVKDATVLKLLELQIRPIIAQADPCFIEEEGARFPGLHSTQIVAKTIEAAMADGVVDDVEAGDIASAERRASVFAGLENQLKVMVGYETGLTDRMLMDFHAQVPAPTAIDDATNRARLAICQEFFVQHPRYYVGTDKRLTIPINGLYFAIVEGRDPRNNGSLGGGAFQVDANLTDFDAMRVNWNWNDPNDPRAAAYAPTTIGYHYMSGVPIRRERSVINVALRNVDFYQIAADLAIFSDLDRDSVHF